MSVTGTLTESVRHKTWGFLKYGLPIPGKERSHNLNSVSNKPFLNDTLRNEIE